MDPAQEIELREIARHRIINETISRSDTPTQQFYKDAVIFVTGGSGFLGKQLIEKLLRACHIKKVFILLRTKKQKSMYERYKEMFKDPVYKYLHDKQPGFTEKIVPIPGDVTDPRLGISDDNWKTLTDEVDVIFHGAATISFVEPLKKATLTNVRGTREMLLLARACKNLRSFVYISTAYAHATPERAKQPVLEKFYSSPIAPEDLLQLVEQYDDHTLGEMTPKILKTWPNTYSFTKAVAEEVTRTMSEDLPVCIVRPAIVVCAYREPTPGWLDKTNVYGPTGFVAGCGLGILHVMRGDTKTNLDLVPVDLVNNASLAAAAETATRRQRGEKDVKIYTVTGTKNPIQFGKVIDIIEREGRKYSPPKLIWYGFGIVASKPVMFSVLTWLLHLGPGHVVDFMLVLLGKKPMLLKVYNKVHKLVNIFSYYMLLDWQFGDSNLRELYWNLSPTDRTIFNFSMDTIDWTLYIVLWCIGCRKYIYKDGLTGTLEGNKKQFRFMVLHYIIVAVVLFGAIMLPYVLVTNVLGL